MNQKFLRATTNDKLILQGLLSSPDNTTDKIVLHIHGMGGNFYENRFLDYMANTFTKNGYAFLSVNTRGHDLIADFPIEGDVEKHKRIGNSREIFEECILDIESWIDLAEKLGYKKIVLQGHSLGSVKVAHYLAAKQDVRVDSLVFLSPPDMISLFEEDNNFQRDLETANNLMANNKEDELLPSLIWDWYLLSAKTFINFSTRENPIDVFNIYDKTKKSILSQISVPTLVILGGEDDAVTISPSEALEVIKSKMPNCRKFNSLVIDDAPHSYFNYENEVCDAIIKWSLES